MGSPPANLAERKEDLLITQPLVPGVVSLSFAPAPLVRLSVRTTDRPRIPALSAAAARGRTE